MVLSFCSKWLILCNIARQDLAREATSKSVEKKKEAGRKERKKERRTGRKLFRLVQFSDFLDASMLSSSSKQCVLIEVNAKVPWFSCWIGVGRKPGRRKVNLESSSEKGAVRWQTYLWGQTMFNCDKNGILILGKTKWNDIWFCVSQFDSSCWI